MPQEKQAAKKKIARSSMFSGVASALGKIDPDASNDSDDESPDDIQMMDYSEDTQLTENDDSVEDKSPVTLSDRIKDLYDESDEEEVQDEEGEEESKDEETEDDDSSDEESESEDEDSDPDLVNDNGTKPTEKTKVFIKSLKDQKKQTESDLAAARAELDTLKASAGSSEEIESMKRELSDLREKLGVIHFEKSPEFIEKYVTPIQNAATKAAKIAGSSIPEDNLEEVKKVWNSAVTYLDAGNEKQYFIHISDMADMIENDTQRRRFEAAAANAWDKKEEHLAAAEDMDATRKQVETEEFNTRERTATNASGKFDKVFHQFERDNESVLQIYRKNAEIFKYDETVKGAKAKIAEGLKKYYTTGVLPDELASVLVSGAIHEVQLNERTALLDMLDALKKRLDAKGGAIEKLKKRTKGKPGGTTVSPGSRRSDEPEQKGSSLMDNVRNALKGSRN